MAFQQRQITGGKEEFNGCQRIKGEGGLTRWSTEGHQRVIRAQRVLWAVKFQEAIMVDTCPYTFVKPTECTTPRVKPNVNCELQLILMYRRTAEILWILFWTTTIKQIEKKVSHKFFGFPVYLKSCVYSIPQSIKCAIALCVKHQETQPMCTP